MGGGGETGKRRKEGRKEKRGGEAGRDVPKMSGLQLLQNEWGRSHCDANASKQVPVSRLFRSTLSFYNTNHTEFVFTIQILQYTTH